MMMHWTSTTNSKIGRGRSPQAGPESGYLVVQLPGSHRTVREGTERDYRKN
jgi:hypothetical protein